MENPWKGIRLEDYEGHMKLDCVGQLPLLGEIMADQLQRYPVSKVMILGVAGGTGLDFVPAGRFEKIYGLDINQDFLKACQKRYSHLKDVFQPMEADLMDQTLELPKADLVIADLLLEFIGYENFQRIIQKVKPCFASCVIQINKDQGFVSNSPYLSAFERLSEVQHEIQIQPLTSTMEKIRYRLIHKQESLCPNGKALVRLDYERQKE